uniref:Uncharacterized protein n=1 Tax=Vespula pensylvanica TaxID=30213 RepID=A0A834N244_VESPE|nr:hypothetical protein H0235_017223 [Vespula pensylvanica]
MKYVSFVLTLKNSVEKERENLAKDSSSFESEFLDLSEKIGVGPDSISPLRSNGLTRSFEYGDYWITEVSHLYYVWRITQVFG